MRRQRMTAIALSGILLLTGGGYRYLQLKRLL